MTVAATREIKTKAILTGIGESQGPVNGDFWSLSLLIHDFISAAERLRSIYPVNVVQCELTRVPEFRFISITGLYYIFEPFLELVFHDLLYDYSSQ